MAPCTDVSLLFSNHALICYRPFEVEWTGAPEDARFDIDLQYCGSYSFCFEVSDGTDRLVPSSFSIAPSSCGWDLSPLPMSYPPRQFDLVTRTRLWWVQWRWLLIELLRYML